MIYNNYLCYVVVMMAVGPLGRLVAVDVQHEGGQAHIEIYLLYWPVLGLIRLGFADVDLLVGKM